MTRLMEVCLWLAFWWVVAAFFVAVAWGFYTGSLREIFFDRRGRWRN